MQLYFSDKIKSVKFHNNLINLQVTESYCVELAEGLQLANSEQQALKKILGNVKLFNPYDKNLLENKNYVFITPRVGTRSSWSSKATDLTNLAGLSSVKSLEKIKLLTWCSEYSQPDITELSDSHRDIYDPLLEDIICEVQELEKIFNYHKLAKKSLRYYDLSKDDGYKILQELNISMSLALSEQELDYLITYCKTQNHQITDVELMMFAQANSEHCRHKIFNADWQIDGELQEKSLFQMIKNTHQKSPNNTIKAYNDNGAIVNSFESTRTWPDRDNIYQYHKSKTHTVIKVETHNHPTAISPFPGAATGSGGEIRDEGATGRGAQPKAGLVGFTVSNLNLANNPWEINLQPPASMQSAQNIMLEGPVGAARFNNEFGRPNICGYFRDFCVPYAKHKYYGYHKPIMLAGGIGTIDSKYTEKLDFAEGCLVIVLGGPALLIGLGGGAASSASADLKNKELDYTSVQRENPEMQRRCQEVINHCWRDEHNPILSIHDVGAGGLSNAIPEIINDSNCGASLDLVKIPTDDYTMSPMELWSNEAQERYVIVIAANDLDKFAKFCQRENCPFAILGTTTKNKINKLILDNHESLKPIDLELDFLFGNTPRITKNISSEKYYSDLRASKSSNTTNTLSLELDEVCAKILKHPTVASKQYLITIGDRSVGGLVARDQMVGPYQVPVADCAVTLTDFTNLHGEAMAIGERTPLAALNPAAAARVAIAEAVTNILSADITSLSDIRLSANWMVASGEVSEDYALYQSVKAIGEEFCPKLGISIPVGKDSMSMRTKWHDNNQDIEVKSPVSLIISAFAPVNNINKTLTPELKLDAHTAIKTELWLIDLNNKNNFTLAGSVYSQVTQSFFNHPDSIDIDADTLKKYAQCIVELKQEQLLFAYHDRSDGGLWATLCEMAFASQVGLDIILSTISNDIKSVQYNLYDYLFNEGLGAVVQIDYQNVEKFKKILNKYNLLGNSHFVAKINGLDEINNQNSNKINIYENNILVYTAELKNLQQLWHETSFLMQQKRDNPKSAQLELSSILSNTHKLNSRYDFSIKPTNYELYIKKNIKPKAAILREQGTNGQIEMAAALMRAGFECADVHMSDILYQDHCLDNYQFLAVCGGFSYGDVLGAGRGWAARILFNNKARDIFTRFFERGDTLTLGVCNGCQMLSQLKQIIPGADFWPEFIANSSTQFEARLSTVKISKSNSILLQGMENSILPIVVSHGEGRVLLSNSIDTSNICLQYIDSNEQIADHNNYPANPNGSREGITGLCSQDGRVTIMMPHPERVFLSSQLSWCPDNWTNKDSKSQEVSPWMRMFYNASLNS